MADYDLHKFKRRNYRNSMNSSLMNSDEKMMESKGRQDNIKIVRDYGESKDDYKKRKSEFSTYNVIGDCKFIENSPNVNEKSKPYQHVKSSNNSKPMFKVIFQNENIARQYGKEIRGFLQDLVSKTSKQATDSSFSDVILEIWDKTEKYNRQISEASEDIGDSKDTSSLFTIDTQPTLKSDIDIPKYRKKYNDVIDADEDKDKNKELEPEEKESCIRQISCFNCSGNHNLRDCKIPWNIANINKNRKELSIRNNNRSIRYHLDDDQRFGHMIPGQISKDLRIALGLRDYELPMHIYRMRELGYPPGWLEEARLQHSGLSLFNSDGIAELDPNDEPGEIVAEQDRDRYDIKKIFDFPGFNVPLPPGTRDIYNLSWTPEKQRYHSKENMLFHLSGKKAAEGYKRKKLKSNTSVTNNSCTVSSYMEIDDLSETEAIVESVPINEHFIPPLPKDIPIMPPEPSSSISTSLFNSESQNLAGESASSLSRTNSLSLSDLESMKKRLLVELEDSSSQSNLDDHMKCNSLNADMKSEVTLSSNENTPESDRSRSTHNIFNTSQRNIKSVDLGTPILQSSSPYNKLPSSEKFSKNICDVINFENLPDSTGKYEQITEVLQKVRTTLAKLHEDS